MNGKFKDIGMKAVFSDLSKDGFFVNFAREYKSQFGKIINVGCPSCRAKAWDDYLKLFKMEKSKSNYELKAKYNGIQLGFNGKPMRNGEFSDPEARKLIKLHPKGEDLFSIVPKKEVKKELKEPKKAKAKK